MKTRTSILAAAGTAVALTAAMVTAAAPGQADGTTSSAFGLSAEGPIPIEPMPTISSSDGRTRTSTAGSLPANPLVSADIAKLTAGNGTAGITLANVALGGDLLGELPEPPAELVEACNALTEQLPVGELPEFPDLGIPGVEVPADPDQLATLCDTLLTPPSSLLGAELIDVSCDGNEGDVRVAGLRLLGQAIDVPSTAPNTEIPADPVLNVTINKQTRNADGSFTVAGVVVSIGDGAEVLTLGSATCGARAAGRAPAQAPAEAPAPVTRDLPVTG